MINKCHKISDPSPSKFTNTWLGSDKVSNVYLVYKAFLAFLFLVGLVQSIIQNTLIFIEKDEMENVYKYFIYLTNNGRLVACFAFGLEAVLVFKRWQKERSGQKDMDDDIGLPPAFNLLWTLCNINCSLSLMITLVYWITLYTPDRHFLDFENFSGHLLIAVANVLDVFISDRPWRLVHAIHPIMFGGVFGIFSFVYFLVGGTNYYYEPYVYHIIDWAHPIRTLALVCGVTVALIIFHGMFCLLYKMRNSVSKCCKIRRKRKKEEKNKEKEVKSEGLLDNYKTRGEVEC